MSGDVQPRKRKDKRRKKDVSNVPAEHRAEKTRLVLEDLPVGEDVGSSGFSSDETIHIHKDTGTGGNVCAKIVFFLLLGALAVMVGLIVTEYRGSSDVDTPVADSRWAQVFDGWVDESPSKHEERDEPVEESGEHDEEHSEETEGHGDDGHDEHEEVGSQEVQSQEEEGEEEELESEEAQSPEEEEEEEEEEPEESEEGQEEEEDEDEEEQEISEELLEGIPGVTESDEDDEDEEEEDESVGAEEGSDVSEEATREEEEGRRKSTVAPMTETAPKLPAQAPSLARETLSEKSQGIQHSKDRPVTVASKGGKEAPDQEIKSEEIKQESANQLEPKSSTHPQAAQSDVADKVPDKSARGANVTQDVPASYDKDEKLVASQSSSGTTSSMSSTPAQKPDTYRTSENPSVTQTTTEKPTVQHTPTEKPTVQHNQTEKSSAPHTSAEKPTVQHIPIEKLAGPHIPKEKLAVPHIPAEQPTVEHIPTEKRSVPHTLPAEQPTVQHSPTEKLSVQHIPAEQPTVEHIPTEKRSVPHTLPAEQPTVQHSPTEKLSVQHIPAEQPTVEHIPTEKSSAPHTSAEKPTVKNIPTEKPTVQHIPTEKPGFPHTPAEKPISQEPPLAVVHPKRTLQTAHISDLRGDKLEVTIPEKVAEILPHSEHSESVDVKPVPSLTSSKVREGGTHHGTHFKQQQKEVEGSQKAQTTSQEPDSTIQSADKVAKEASETADKSASRISKTRKNDSRTSASKHKKEESDDSGEGDGDNNNDEEEEAVEEAVGEEVGREDTEDHKENGHDDDDSAGVGDGDNEDEPSGAARASHIAPEESGTEEEGSEEEEVVPVRRATSTKSSGEQGYVRADISSKDDLKIREELDLADAQLEENPEEALNTFMTILRTNPTSPRAHYGKAQALDRLAEKKQSNSLLQEAIDAYEHVLALGASVPDELFVQAAERCINRMRFKGQYHTAVHIHKKLMQRFSHDPAHANQLAVTYLMINRLTDAKRILEDTLRRWPHNGFAQVHYGFILKTGENDNKAAVDYMTRGIATREPGTIDGRFFFHLGDALTRLGRHDEASKIYELGVREGLFLSKYQRSLYNVDRLRAQPWWTPEETTYSKYFKIHNSSGAHPASC